MEIKGTVNDIAVVDDYGHHPTEIKATLLAAKNMREGRVIAVFQPHRYTRTMKLFDEFSTAFNDADIVIVTDIYAAGEKEIEGVSSVNLYRSIGGNGHKKVLYLVSFGEVVDYLCSEAKPGDTVISLGAGDVYRAGEEFLEKLESEADD
jgi:UDP-N-acetylmuramate--alanine ligase